MRTLRVRMLVFVFQLQINRPKRICVMVLCLVDHVKFCSRYVIFNFQSFPLMFLKLRCRFRFTVCFRCSHFTVIIFDSSPHLLSSECGQPCRRFLLHHFHPKITCVTQTYDFFTGRLKVTVTVLFNFTRNCIFNVGQVFFRQDYASLKPFINRYCSTIYQCNGEKMARDWRVHNCQCYLIWSHRIQPASLYDKYIFVFLFSSFFILRNSVISSSLFSKC